ncbi:mitogen-activated protein kinase kinase kinase 7 isoform X4 [Hydra vulgaris]|uniref:Mitogen-activated protein kinase kinase kinase 7 isoform X4 n=1 Tax=Hydra vulgaris TaxID=6087 RepID=A0ABM4BJE3_HYDVU
MCSLNDFHNKLDHFILSPSHGLPSSPPRGFINEIDYNELTSFEIIGRGAYGTVQKAIWKNKMVAIKTIENQNDPKEFRDEAKRLSMVQHKNIIQLYGTIVNGPKQCLVMELAECGSLYTLLHTPLDTETIHYTFAHVLNWSLQCAEAVEYLHNIKPKPIIHRDLKPLNMLLMKSGTVLKICDFGAACHLHSDMTSNKGTPSWMAPEVFEGSRYGEKCDVYSFGIILWEMLTRKKPFDGIPCQIMWKVMHGVRPAQIKGVPQCFEVLIKRCWEKEEKDRPAFVDIVKFLKKANLYVTGGRLPIMEPAYKQLSWVDSEIPSSVSIKQNNQERNIESSQPITPENISTSPIRINEHFQLTPPTQSSKFYDPCQSQWNLIPPDLMPICPLEDPRSYHIYENYMEALKKYISIQSNIEFLKQRRDNLKQNIIDLHKEQSKDPCLADFIAAQESRQQLLEMLKTIKPLLENERAKFAKKSLINR